MAPKTLRFGHPGAALPGPGGSGWHLNWLEAAVWVLPRRGRRSSDGTQVGTKLPSGCSRAGAGALQMAPKLARSCRLGAPAPGPALFRWHPDGRDAAVWVLPHMGRHFLDSTQIGAKLPFGCSCAVVDLFFGHPNGSKPRGWVLLPRPGRLKSGRP